MNNFSKKPKCVELKASLLGYSLADIKNMYRQHLRSRQLYNTQTKAPRYIRCYDNPYCADRYTIVFTKKKESFGYKDKRRHRFLNLGCSSTLSISSLGETMDLIDKPSYKHLGKRISFNELPDLVRTAVEMQYIDLWKITANEIRDAF